MNLGNLYITTSLLLDIGTLERSATHNSFEVEWNGIIWLGEILMNGSRIISRGSSFVGSTGANMLNVERQNSIFFQLLKAFLYLGTADYAASNIEALYGLLVHLQSKVLHILAATQELGA
jgi:hypothetical protein